ncbi:MULTISPECIES: fumarylacetoacetate hydrolase family protein [Pontibacillus]|uniref:Fumarylacetoacetate hydrolase family protein n=1 Tax=Pontibacillus chungwhensis TaxID=265426 RepID=A0ABY8V0G3_9BACI|nr:MULTISPECIES: fumarylacetoacetate hydrolase family protein [Pontibacillus]MCD5322144.1 fumarylacetoacetate hydrolase family protein [Pontibacillus sp. HN14]WIF99441.1 fumarylacetoacetate hydrolase family protein [Pontibacillus chungwhensis]
MKKAMVQLSGVPQAKEMMVDPAKGTLSDGEEALRLDFPLSGNVYGTAMNYKGNLDEFGLSLHEDPYKKPPEAPVLYMKPRNTFTGPETNIAIPDGETEVEIGASLAIVFGRTTSKVQEKNALDYVSGYTIVNDISIPHESIHRPAIKEKSRDGFCAAGPWIVSKDDVINPDDLGIRIYVNGALRQEHSTSELVRPVGKLIADVSSFMTFSKGDVLLVGLPPGAPRVQSGDEVRIQIDEIGALTNHFVSEHSYVKEGNR